MVLVLAAMFVAEDSDFDPDVAASKCAQPVGKIVGK